MPGALAVGSEEARANEAEQRERDRERDRQDREEQQLGEIPSSSLTPARAGGGRGAEYFGVSGQYRYRATTPRAAARDAQLMPKMAKTSSSVNLSCARNADSRSGIASIVESCAKIWSVLSTILDSVRSPLHTYCHGARTGPLRSTRTATTTHAIASATLANEPPRDAHDAHLEGEGGLSLVRGRRPSRAARGARRAARGAHRRGACSARVARTHHADAPGPAAAAACPADAAAAARAPGTRSLCAHSRTTADVAACR